MNLNKRIKEIICELSILISQIENRKHLYKEQLLKPLVKENKNFGLDNISVTECHAIAVIGSEDEVNGIKIADRLGMTRGGISKIVAGLIKKDLVVSYQDGMNQRKIFYKLTPLGETFDKKHNKWHEDREKAIKNTIAKYTEEEQEFILRFIKDLQEAKI